MILHRRLAVAAAIAAAAIAVPAAALAAGPGSPPGKPAPPPASAAIASKSAAATSPPAGTQASKSAQPDQPPAPVTAFATRLGVAADAAGRAFKQLAGLSNTNEVDPASPAFAAIARDLGVSPAQLAAAWAAVSQSVAGQ